MNFMTKIKTIIFTLIISLFITINVFPQADIDTGGNNPNENIATSTNAPRTIPEDELIGTRFHVGFITGVGLSRNTVGNYAEGKFYNMFSFDFSAAVFYYFSIKIGILAEIGFHHFVTKEENNVLDDYHKFTLDYIYISATPLFAFDNIYFGFGLFFGFPVKAEYEGTGDLHSKTSYYNSPDVGLTFKVGYSFKSGKNIKMFLGLNLKYQLNNFYTSGGIDGRTIAIYLNFAMLFGIKK